jgi:DNA-binding beta-propeller fold protein YncE
MPAKVVVACFLMGCASPSQTPSTAPSVPRTAGLPTDPQAQTSLPTPSYLTSTRIVATRTGTLVIDQDSGTLVRTDGDGVPIARLSIGRDPGLLAFDPERSMAFVADREHDRVVAVDVGDAVQLGRAFAVPPEPYGVALTADRSTLLVSTIADQLLVALDAHTGVEKWRTKLSADPRAISVSPDGTRALVASIGGGGVDEVSLETRVVTPIAFDLACDRCDKGPAFARSSGAVVFIDQHRAIAPFQRAVPESIDNLGDSYYGGGRSPVTQHLAFLSFTPTRAQSVAQIIANQPRSILWDQASDVLLVGGFASDTLLRLQGLTRGTTTEAENAAADFVLRPRDTCGPDGFARAADDTIYVWCALSRTIVRIDPPDPTLTRSHHVLDESKPIATSSLSMAEHRGKVLFMAVHDKINGDRTLACTTCHIDGKTDGHSWKIREHSLQTPMLAGRIAKTAPYKWDGHDKTIRDSVGSTIKRLNGWGLDAGGVNDLVAYMHAMPAPRRPTVDPAAVARGKRVFEQKGCDDCHAGSHYTDGAQHVMGGHPTDPINIVDTPSLIGIAASAPYYHDGSATTLESLVAGGGNIKGMGDLKKLSDAERADLVAFLTSL